MLLRQLPAYFKKRRDALIQAYPGAAFIFPAYPDFVRNSDVHHAYRQESNFFYLTGFQEPESFLVLLPSFSKSGSYRTILFVLPKDLDKEMWEGERYGIEGAQTVFGADEAYLSDEFDDKMPSLLQECEKVFYRIGRHSETDRRILSILEAHRRIQGRSGRGLLSLEDPQGPVGEMRLFKSSEEIEIMRQGGKISAQAHRQVMREVKPGMNESEVEALIDYLFRKAGCQRLGYGSIVAGGKNAACLHYRMNNDELRDHELLLIDAGGEYQYYSADITRTFPVGRSFTPSQAQVYDLVLRAEKEGISRVRPGAKLPEIHKHVCEVMIEGLLSLGLLKGKPHELFKSGEFKKYYPHNTSHWLGMDVHDAGLYLKNGEPRVLEPGMVLTIEPGFYVQPLDRTTPAEFRDMGIRIEDDILVTDRSFEILTQDAPKERDEIETLKSF